MYENEVKMAASFGNMPVEPPRESVEALLNAAGERMCRVVALIDEVMALQYGDGEKTNMACEPAASGFYGLAMALNRDSRILLERAELFRKRFGG